MDGWLLPIVDFSAAGFSFAFEVFLAGTAIFNPFLEK